MTNMMGVVINLGKAYIRVTSSEEREQCIMSLNAIFMDRERVV